MRREGRCRTSEPTARAAETPATAQGARWSSVEDERTDGRVSASYAVPAGSGVAFCPGVLLRVGGVGAPRFVGRACHHDGAEAPRGVEHPLELSLGTLCLAHGNPLADGPKRAVRAMLAAT